MKQVVIIDDETIIRVALKSMRAWEACGFEVTADFAAPRQALAWMEDHPADLVITDMKMPELDGLGVLRKLQELPHVPVSVVLSGYHEFEQVREAFKMGAFDYMLKSDLQEEALLKLLRNLNEKVEWRGHREIKEGIQKKAAANRPEEGKFAVVLFEIKDFQKQIVRFGNDWEEKLAKPFLELARQIPRVASKAVLDILYPSRYVMYYRVTDEDHYRQHIVSIVKQLQSVWKDYMNLEISAAIGECKEAQELEQGLDDVVRLMRTAVLEGHMAVCTLWEKREQIGKLELAEGFYQELIAALYSADAVRFEEEKKVLFHRISQMEYGNAKEECLIFIILLGLKFKEYNDDFTSLFPEEINYYDKLNRLSDRRELELWLNNYLRWVLDYCGNRHDSRQADLMLRAKRFIADNYMTPELTLGSVAAYAGLNEKYFSARFTKETGRTFSHYLLEIRMQKARELLQTTELKIYEISERIGYNNVEHFNRLFKRQFGISPGDLKKKREI